MPNVELLEQTMQYLVDHPDEHNQRDVWNPCGTPGCFLGWAQFLSGIRHRDRASGYYTDESTIEWAVRVLGLSHSSAITIFQGRNTLPMLQLMIKDVLNGDEVVEDTGHYRQLCHFGTG